MATEPNRPFVWGARGQKMTPEEVDRQRQVAQAFLQAGSDFSPATGGWAEALGRGFSGWASGRLGKIASLSEEMGIDAVRQRAAANPSVAAALGLAPSTVTASSMGGASPVAAALAGGEATPHPAPPGAAGHSVGDGHDHSDWLRYTNQGATRNQPISPELASAMSFLPELGLSMEVYSGGQPGIGEGGARVGSTRHDHGGAADVMFYDATGRMLDWNNPNDIATFQEIVRRALAAGVTGIGAGDDYMGAGRMHVGFGDPGVWGAGGKGANAPEWLREAYGGAPAGTPGGSPVASALMSGPSSADLFAIRADPWAARAFGPALDELAAQASSRENAQLEAWLRQQDPMYQAQLARAELELEQMRNPAAPAPIEVGGVLLDPVTFEPIFDSRSQSDRGFTLSPGQQRFDEAGNPIASVGTAPDGFSLISPDEAAQLGLPEGVAYQVEDGTGRISAIGGGGVNVNVGGDNNADPLWGTPDPGFVWARDEAGNVITEQDENGYMRPRQLPIAGGAADVERQATAAADQAAAERAQLAQENAAQYASTVTRDIGTALRHLDDSSFSGDGILSANVREMQASVPGTAMWNMQKFVDSALSNLTLDTMNRMRESSPAGATGFGNMSERQMGVIQGVMGNWSPGLPLGDQRMILNQLGNFYLDVQFGSEAERREAVASGLMTPEENAAIQELYWPVTRDEIGRDVDEATAPAASSGTGSPEATGEMGRFATMSVQEISNVIEGLSGEEREQAMARLRQIAGE